MNITFTQTQYKSNKAIPVKNQTLSHRDVLILDIYDGNGRLAQSEACPLPGLSTETIEDVKTELDHLINKNDPNTPLKANDILERGIEALWKTPALSPSTTFAIEGGILSYLAKKTETPLANLLSKHPANNVPQNALLIPKTLLDSSKLKTNIQNKKKAGIRTFKIKIGHFTDPIDDIEWLQEAASYLDNTDTIRLDFNGQWPLNTLIEASKEWDGLNIDYAEDPSLDWDTLQKVHDATQWPIAVDEWALRKDIDTLIHIPGLKAIVVKPSIYGGIHQLHQLHQRCQRQQIDIVISSAFEGPIGHSILHEIAKAYSPNIPAGLDTLHYLETPQ